MDSRATDYMTTNPSQITTTFTYQSIDQFQVGSGENLISPIFSF